MPGSTGPFLLFSLFLLFFSCATISNPPESLPDQPTDSAELPDTQSESETAAQSASASASELEQTETIADETPYVVSDQTYIETFFQVEEVIRELNGIIDNRQFDKWLAHLSEDYYSYYNNPGKLELLSESRRLRSSGIRLENIKDFFTYVVVPSRANYRLDDLVFRSPSKLEAIMIVQEERILVYRLQFINGYWKIIR